MKQSVRYFSIGLLTSSLLIFGYYFFFDEANSDPLETIPVETFISQIELEGYRVITEEEFNSLSLIAEDVEARIDSEDENSTIEEGIEENLEDNSQEESNEKNEESIRKITFKIQAGTVLTDVAEILFKNKIIEDELAFKNYLEDNGYSSKIQLGEFEITSDMSFAEIAEIITTYRED